MAIADPSAPALPPSTHRPRPYSGPSKQEVLALRKQFLNPTIFTYYKEPLMIVEGHMQYLYDETGRRYLDGFGGIVTVSVGHCHPKIVAAVNRQNEILQHTTTIYLNPVSRSTPATSPPGCPAISRSATSSTPAPRPTTSRSSWPGLSRATSTSSPCATATTAAACRRWG